METSKNSSSKLIVMTVLEPKDELDEVKFIWKFVCCEKRLVIHVPVSDSKPGNLFPNPGFGFGFCNSWLV